MFCTINYTKGLKRLAELINSLRTYPTLHHKPSYCKKVIQFSQDNYSPCLLHNVNGLNTILCTVLYTILCSVLDTIVYTNVIIAGWTGLLSEDHFPSCLMYIVLNSIYCILYWTLHCTLLSILLSYWNQLQCTLKYIEQFTVQWSLQCTHDMKVSFS